MGESYPYEGAIEKVAEVAAAPTKLITDFFRTALGPAVEQYGLMLGDIAKFQRLKNLAKIVQLTNEKTPQQILESERIPPRICYEVIEKGSWFEDHVVQDLWAGLLSSSFSKDGDDDSNMIFIGLLSNMTKVQARLLNYFAKDVKRVRLRNGVIETITQQRGGDVGGVFYSTTSLISVGECSPERCARELGIMEAAGLVDMLNSGYLSGNGAYLQMSRLGLQLYARAQGSFSTIKEFCESHAIEVSEASG